MFLLLPLALHAAFRHSLGGRDSSGSLWQLCHLAARAV